MRRPTRTLPFGFVCVAFIVLGYVAAPSWVSADLSRTLPSNAFEPSSGIGAKASGPHIQASLIVDKDSLLPPNDPEAPAARIGVMLSIEPGWHVYWQNSGEAGMPTKVQWQLPDGWTAGTLNWPVPFKFVERGDILTFGYERELLLWTTLTGNAVLPKETETLTLGAKVTWLACKDICVPGTATVSKEITFSTTTPEAPSAEFPLFEDYARDGLTQARLNNIVVLPVDDRPTSQKGVPVAERQANPLSLVLELPSSADLEVPSNIAAQLQVFPSAPAGLSVRVVRAHALKRTGVLQLALDLTRSDATAPQEGLVIIGPELSPSKRVAVAPWKIPATSGEKAASVYDSVLRSGREIGPLTYRAMFHDGASSSSDDNERPPSAAQPGPEQSWYPLLAAMLSAFLGGMLLNLMPCVLPILAIKVMGFVNNAGEDRSRIWRGSLAYTSGVVFSFMSLAAVVITLQRLGYSLGWGFQFQHPQFVLGLAVVVFILGLSFFDVFTITLPFIGSATKSAGKIQHPLGKHFFDGVLATALSTPCTAPFLGTALAFAFSQSPFFTVLVFLSIAIGLAIPYVYLSLHPKMLGLLPAPGDWMYTFRQFMGFLLLGTVVWLLFIMHHLTADGSVWTVVLLLWLYFLMWAWGRSAGLRNDSFRHTAFLLAIVLVGAGGVAKIYPSAVRLKGAEPAVEESRIRWEKFSPALLAQYRQQNRTVFLDFTAAWCITCKVNEYLIIDTPAVAAAINEYGISPVKADWTDGSAEVTSALKSYGAEGVPLYVVIPGSGEPPIVLSTLPSVSSLTDAFAKGSARSAAK